MNIIGQSYPEKNYSINTHQKSIPEILWQLSDENDLTITFGDNDFNDKRYNLSIQNKPLALLLDKILEPTFNTYSITKNEILVYPDPSAKITINGYIYDEISGEHLIGANVYTFDLKSQKQIGTSTNVYGFFSLKIPYNAKSVLISYLGYQTKTITTDRRKNNSLQIKLIPDYTVDEIVITTQERQKKVKRNINDFENEDLAIFKKLPSLGGDLDIIRSIQMLPGAQTGPDGFGGLHVRGGNADQNLVLLDGVPIYNPYHALGLYSIFDESIIKNVKYLRGHFPARYGGRLSSVLDIRTKEGNSQDWNFSVGTGLILSKISVEGPLVKDKVNFILSARRSHLDPFLNSYSKKRLTDPDLNKKGEFNYYFGEILSKLNFNISQKSKLFISYYKGKDNYQKNIEEQFIFSDLDTIDLIENQNLNWGNELASLRWNNQLSQNIFSNLTMTYSTFKFVSFDNISENLTSVSQEDLSYSIKNSYLSKIESYNLKYDIDFVPNPKNYIRAGVNISNDIFKPGLSNEKYDFFEDSQEVNDTIFNAPSTENFNFTTYVENDWKVSSKLKINAGLFNVSYFLKNKTIFHIDPRISLSYDITPKLQLRLSGNRMTQYLHLLTRVGSSLPNDLWVPSTENVDPQRAWLFDVDVNYAFSENLNLNVTAYYKQLENIIGYADGSFRQTDVAINAIDWEESISVGRGISKGIETMLRFQNNKSVAWINYTYSDATRQFEDINSGFEFPFQYNLRHVINVMGSHKLSKRWTIGANWTYSSGLQSNLARQEWSYIRQNGNYDIIYKDLGPKNSFQLPANHRLDISSEYRKNTIWGSFSIKSGIYNAYNHKNIIQIKPKFDEDTFEERFKAISLIPILPYFSVTIKF